MIVYLILILLLWLAISIWFFLRNIGQKYRKQKWYDWPILAPVFIIILIATGISTLFGWNK